jgi:glycosyltransferase involved in cell wall biosynthesis
VPAEAPPGASGQPFVTVVIPCLDEEGFIEACLDSVRRQDYPGDRIEILVADGRSRDATREILARVCGEDPRVRMIDNPDRLQAAGMNAAIRCARGELIVRMDAHCEYAPDYVRRCVEVSARTGAENVGGAARARARTSFQRALCAALQSPLGVGGARYRSPNNEGWVDTLFNGAFRRRVFETVGLYDPRAFTNEDADLNQRILESGGRVYLSREIVVHYFPRGSFRALARQYFRYGMGRARTLLKHGRFRSLRPAIPFLMVVAGLLLVALPVLRPLLPWALLSYGAAALFEAARVSRSDGLALAPRVTLVFPVLHLAHGLGFATGLLRFTLRPDFVPVERIEPRASSVPGLLSPTPPPATDARG